MVKIDKIDKQLLRKLNENAKVSLKELAEVLGVHQNTLMNRIKRLETLGIISNFTLNLDLGKLGYTSMAIIRIRFDDRKNQIDGLMKKIAEIPQVAEVFEVTGNSDANVLVRSRSNEELLKVIKKIRHIDGILETNSQHILKIHKEYPQFDPFKIEESD
jgi:DNA-binding Lrp family transcriptional regulator